MAICYNHDIIITAIDKTITHIEKIYKFEDVDFIIDLKNTLALHLNEYIIKLTKKQNKIKKQKMMLTDELPKVKLTDYNLFIKDKYDEIKKQKKETNETISYNESKTILKDIAKEWSQNKTESSSSSSLSINKKSKRITGYNLYYKRNVTELLKTKPQGITIMRHVSNNWCDLGITIKEDYNSEAKEITKALILSDCSIIK
jgi:hypothetical protein